MKPAVERAAPHPSLGFAPTPLVGLVDTDVWRVRRLSALFVASDARVVCFGSSMNAVRVLGSTKCDVVVVGDDLEGPSAAELCDALRDKLGADRPFFLLLEGAERVGAEHTASFDAEAAHALDDEGLLAALSRLIRARRDAMA